jgi:hypothetical protein
MDMVIGFILSVIGVCIRFLCISVYSLQEKKLQQNLYCMQYKIADSQYRKIFIIWELGKNRFT